MRLRPGQNCSSNVGKIARRLTALFLSELIIPRTAKSTKRKHAGLVVSDTGFGLIGDIIIGIIGAFVAGFLFPRLASISVVVS